MANEIRIDPPRKAVMVVKLKAYLAEELDLEVGGFDAEFLLDFVGKELGNYFYNQGLEDAQAAMASRMESIAEAIDLLERPT